MYSMDQIFSGITQPRNVIRELNRLCHTRGGRYTYNPEGTGIFEKDWDNLIILDACRYDIFEQLASLPGKTEYRYSKAPATYQFIPANFKDRSLLDTVYVGANSWYLKLKEDINSEIYKFINLQENNDSIEWINQDLRVPTPQTVSKHAKRAASNHQNKRLIVHFLQPHHPYIGPTAEENFVQNSSSLLDVIEQSHISISQLRRAYCETLSTVLPEVEVLLSELNGKTVVTSDHGEMLGDRHDYFPIRDFGHHPGIFNDSTVKVPWHVYEDDTRRKVTPDPPVTPNTDERKIDEQLEHLGYKL